MQFMPADFEVPLFAVERVGGVVVKSTHGFDDRSRAVHGSGQTNGLSSRDFGPLFPQAVLVEKDDCQLLDLVFLNIAGGCVHTSRQDGQDGAEEESERKGFGRSSPLAAS